MSGFIDSLRSKSAYGYIVIGVAWLAIAAIAGSFLIVWLVVACLASGILLLFRPSIRFTWAWVLATGALGFLLAAYQVYAWAPFIVGAFSVVAGEAVAVFAALALIHILLFFAGATKPKSAKPGPS